MSTQVSVAPAPARLPTTAPASRPTLPTTAPASRPTQPARPGAGSAPLSLVPPLRSGAPRAPFVVLLGTLLTAGLAGLLFLHTALAEDSFRLQDLKNRSALLTDREQTLAQQVAAAAAPRRLAARAEGLGMVRSENPAFIRLSDGKVLGRPKPGGPAPAPVAAVPATSAPEAVRGGTGTDSAPEGGAGGASGAGGAVTATAPEADRGASGRDSAPEADLQPAQPDRTRG